VRSFERVIGIFSPFWFADQITLYTCHFSLFTITNPETEAPNAEKAEKAEKTENA